MGLIAILICCGGTRGGQCRLYAADDSAREAATVAAAIKVIDLRSFALPAGAVVEGVRQSGMVNYSIKADPKKAFQTQQQQFLKLGWKELPGTMAEPAYGVGLFQKSNFVVSVTTSDAGMPDQPGMSRVSIINFGNIRPGKLPVVPGAKSLFANDANALYVTDLKLTAAIETMRKLLLAAGWEPYGSTGSGQDNMLLTFKRNAIQVTAFIGVAPAQGGKTSIQLGTMQLSADIPAPADAVQLQYVDEQKTLRFESPGEFTDVAKFYQQTLARQGWKSTTEELVTQTDDFKRPTGMLVFRNAARDLMSLDLHQREGRTQVLLTHQTADEFAAAEKRAKAAAQLLVAEREKEAANAAKKPMPTDAADAIEALANKALADALGGKAAKTGKTTKGNKDSVLIAIPEKAGKVSQPSDNVLQIKVAAGTGKAAAERIRDQLVAAGWKIDGDDDLDKDSGNLTFKKGAQQISLNYVDTGILDVNLMLIGIGATLEPGKAEPSGTAPGKKPATDATPVPKPGD